MITKLRVTLVGTAVILLILLLLGSRGAPEPLMSLRGAPAQTHDIYNSIYAPGEIEAVDSSELSAPRAAIVTALYVKTGDTVQKGQAMLRLRETTLTVTEDAAAAFAQRVLEGELPDPSSVSVALTGAATQTTEEYVVYAEMSGTVLRMPTSVGEQVLPGLSYAKIADLSRLRVRAQIPEAYIMQVREGQRANVVSDAAPENTTAAVVQTVAPFARRAVSFTGSDSAACVETVLSLIGNTDGLRPGYSASVKIFTDAVQDAVLVPYEAIVQQGTSEYVFVVDDHGIAHRLHVQTGYELDGYIEIKAGIAAGDVVLLSPPDALQDGDRVEVTGL